MDELTTLILSVLLSVVVGQIVAHAILAIGRRHYDSETYQTRIIKKSIRKYMEKERKGMVDEHSRIFSDFLAGPVDFKSMYLEHDGMWTDDLYTGKDLEESVETYLLKELKDSKKGISCCVVGDYGSGKTTLLMYLFNELCKNKKSLVIIAPLRKADKTLDIKSNLMSAVAKSLKKHGIDIPNTNLFEQLVADGKIILLLDGLDEYLYQLRRYPSELFNVLGGLDKLEKIIMTSRPSSFQGVGEHYYDMFKDERSKISNTNMMDVLMLKPFDEKKVEAILKHKKCKNEDIKKITENEQLLKLCKQHILLEMVLEILPNMEGDYDVADVFKNYVERQFKDDRFATREQALGALEQIAYAMYANQQSEISIDNIKSLVGEETFVSDRQPLMSLRGMKSLVGEENLELNNLHFLSYQGNDSYKFTHMSFIEYFTARHIINTLKSEEVPFLENLRSVVYSHEITKFMKNISSDNDSKFKNCLDSEDKCIKYTGLYIYTRIKRSEEQREHAKEYLIERLDSEKSLFFKREICISLAYMGYLEEFHGLVYQLENDANLDEKVDNYGLNYFYSNEKIAIEDCVRRLKVKKYYMRAMMIRFLEKHGNCEHIPLLQGFYDDELPFIRRVAKRAVVAIATKYECSDVPTERDVLSEDETLSIQFLPTRNFQNES